MITFSRIAAFVSIDIQNLKLKSETAEEVVHADV
jgi:hypothetical protein